MTTIYTLRCAVCGSTEIQRDAVMQWDADAQDYIVVALLDDLWCEQCRYRDGSDGEPVWVEVQP